MTIPILDLHTLKRLKNSVIGNPSAKTAVAQDAAFLQALIECLNDPPPHPADGPDGARRTAMRVEAAHVLASLSLGSETALGTLLRSRAHQAFLFAISRLEPADPLALRAALARGLRMLAASLADVVGPPQWGLRSDTCEFKVDASVALEYLFEQPVLDIFLPLLVDPSPQVGLSVALLLSSCLRLSAHRAAVADWLPPADRMKESKGKRGWEKPDLFNASSPSRQGGWVARNLATWLRSRDVRLQEAALLALGALSRDNPAVAIMLAKPNSEKDGPTPLALATSHCKSRSVEVQLAACFCTAHIVKANPVVLNSMGPALHESSLTALHTLNRMIASFSETQQARTKACFILYQLVSDDVSLCQTAVEHGSMTKLTSLVVEITPLGPEKAADWDSEEPESTSALREACLTTLASLALFENSIRRTLIDTPDIVAVLHAALSHSRHAGVRYAACQCVRALSRAVAVVRTSLVDTGLGRAVIAVFMREGEERRVTWAALAAVCNLVVDFSPLREEMLKDAAVERLVQLMHADDPALRLNALWAIKNLLWKSPSDTKRSVMERVGWHALVEMMTDSDVGLQEQAFHVLRHLADKEEDVEMTFQVIGSDVLLGALSIALDSDSEDVQTQAVGLLANLSNGFPTYQAQILAHPRIISSLRLCLVDAKVEVRRPAISCVLQLVRGAVAHPKRHRELREAGFQSTLRHMCEGGPPGAVGMPLGVGGGLGGGINPSHTHAHGGQMGIETDREVRDKAREALYCLEHDVDLA